MLVLLLGCTQPSAPPLYKLNLSPQVPINQADLLTGLNSVVLTLVSPTGETSDPIDLGKPVKGSTLKGNGPKMDIAWVEAAGELGGALTAWGRTPLLEEDLKSTLLVASTQEVGQLAPIEGGLYGAQVTALGNGEYLVSGGATDGVSSDLWRRFSVGNLQEGLKLEEEGVLPPYDGSAAGRAGHGVVALGGVDAGKLLIQGGAGEWGNSAEYDWDEWESNITTIPDSVVVYNPADQSVETVTHDTKTRLRKYGHSAFGVSLPMPDGGAVWWGGWNNDREVREYEILELLPGGTRETRLFGAADLTDYIVPGPLGAAGATIDAGAVICGGGSVNSSSTLAAVDACILIANGGTISQFESLPQPLAGLQMIALDGQRILAVGGATMPEVEVVDGLYFHVFQDGYPASDLVYLYDGSSWSRLMTLPGGPVAGHRLSLLPDGRVLIYGGTNYYSYYSYPTPVDEGTVEGRCATVLNVETQEVSTLTGCYDMPFAASVALDPEFGLLEVGGMANGTDGSLGVNFIPSTLSL